MTYRATTSKSPGDVLQDLEFAIGARNYRITSRNSIGVAIEHRENIPFSDAEVIHFCNVEAAQRLLELSPDYLVHMPCRIAVWRGIRGTFVETLLVPLDIHPASAGMVEEINRMLREIVDSAVEPWN